MIAKNVGVDIFSLINYIKYYRFFCTVLMLCNIVKAISDVQEGFQKKIYLLIPRAVNKGR